MVYQELISSYENKGLDITSLKILLEAAKPLKGRLKYRAIDIIAQRSAILNDINNLLIVSEIADKLNYFENDVNKILNNYFMTLVQSIKSAKAWKFMKLEQSEYTLEIFESLNKKEQFKKIYSLNEKYLEFLGYQNIADIRDCLDNANELSDETIEKLEFLRLMFDGLKNREVKIEFFCFDKAFLKALIDFWNSKSFKLEDYMKIKRKNTKKEYKKYSQFFTKEDFRDIAENLDLAKKILKVPANTIIDAYSELSESEAEVYYIEEEFKGFKKLEEKYKRMQVVKKEYEKLQAKLEKERKEREKLEEKLRIEEEKRLAEEERKKALEKIAESLLVIKPEKEEKTKKNKKEDVVKKEKEPKEEKSKKTSKKEIENKSKEEKQQETVKEEFIDEIYIQPKEQVNPLIFSWVEREDVTIARKIGSKNLLKFFEKIKEIEERTGIRVSLYIVSNAGKDVTLKRLKDLKKKAKQNGLPNLVEGALGGYSSFRIDENENISDIFIMTEDVREEIINIIENIKGVSLKKEFVDVSEENYIRYDLTNSREKEITKKYLNLTISKILKDENINEMTLKVLSFMEGKKVGIDILMQDQIKGISQISEYYKEKYIVAPGKIMNVKIDGIEDFINKENII